MNEQISVYLVTTRENDFNARVTEVVIATELIAKEYYTFKKIDAEDVFTIGKYFDIVPQQVEMARINERRFYGND